MVHMGATYESKSGKGYKVIDGKRYQIRGLKVIADTPLVTKAGALINFDFNSAEIRPDSFPLLNEFGKALNGGLGGIAVRIAGHSDHKGPIQYNQILSEKRALSVKNYLQTQHGINPNRVEIKGFGDTRPIASNDSVEGRQKNRLVEFIRLY